MSISSFKEAVKNDDVLKAAIYFHNMKNKSTSKKGLGGHTPLIYAICHTAPNVVNMIVDSGVDLEQRLPESYTALHYALYCEQPEIVDLLVEAGANVDAVDNEGYTLLHEAINKKNLDAVCILLSVGADKTIVTKEGLTAHSLAIKNHSRLLARVIEDSGGMSPFSLRSYPSIVNGAFNSIQNSWAPMTSQQIVMKSTLSVYSTSI